MAPRVSVGDAVQTPLGKGVVREVRGNGRIVVDMNGRAVMFEAGAVEATAALRKTRKHKPAPAPDVSPTLPADRAPAPDVDLHGLTVDEALARAEQAVNDALLADVEQLRLIHGQSGGRIRAALHRRLREISSVRAFRLDPRNAGVTIVNF